MKAGEELLALARADGRTSLFVVGTGKNAGKTVTMRAIAAAAVRRRIVCGMTSAGRDGETFDAVDAMPKPRLFLSAGTIVATASGLLPHRGDFERLAETHWHTATGDVLFVRVNAPAFYELAGPPKASDLRRCVQRLHQFGAEQVIVDGAIDRVAALAGGDDAVIVAAGADAGKTLDEAASNTRAFVDRLRLPAADPDRPLVRIEGALTEARAREMIECGERRQVVVLDPTRITIAGSRYLRAAEQLQLRCDRPLHVVAVTVAPIGRDAAYDSKAFAAAIASGTGLPVFDVYADAATEPAVSKGA